MNVAEMQTSQQVAAAVALRSLGKKVTTVQSGALIAAVKPGFPAAKSLQQTDVIVAVDGRPVHTPSDVERVMAGRPVGTTFRFTIMRNHRSEVVPLATVPAGDGSKRGVVGVILGDERVAPLAGPRVDRRRQRLRPVRGPRLRARRRSRSSARTSTTATRSRRRARSSSTAASARSAVSSKRRSAHARRVWMFSSFRRRTRPTPASTHTVCESSL